MLHAYSTCFSFSYGRGDSNACIENTIRAEKSNHKLPNLLSCTRETPFFQASNRRRWLVMVFLQTHRTFTCSQVFLSRASYITGHLFVSFFSSFLTEFRLNVFGEECQMKNMKCSLLAPSLRDGRSEVQSSLLLRHLLFSPLSSLSARPPRLCGASAKTHMDNMSISICAIAPPQQRARSIRQRFDLLVSLLRAPTIRQETHMREHI